MTCESGNVRGWPSRVLSNSVPSSSVPRYSTRTRSPGFGRMPAPWRRIMYCRPDLVVNTPFSSLFFARNSWPFFRLPSAPCCARATATALSFVSNSWRTMVASSALSSGLPPENAVRIACMTTGMSISSWIGARRRPIRCPRAGRRRPSRLRAAWRCRAGCARRCAPSGSPVLRAVASSMSGGLPAIALRIARSNAAMSTSGPIGAIEFGDVHADHVARLVALGEQLASCPAHARTAPTSDPAARRCRARNPSSGGTPVDRCGGRAGCSAARPAIVGARGRRWANRPGAMVQAPFGLGAASAFSMASTIAGSSGVVFEPQLAIRRPSRPMRYLWKFHFGGRWRRLRGPCTAAWHRRRPRALSRTSGTSRHR